MKNIILLVLIFQISSICFAQKNMAKVLVIKGKASKLVPGAQKATAVKKGDRLPMDTSILTRDKSFVLVKLVNGDTMSLGGNSKMVINLTGATKTSFISLLKGQLRSVVPNKNKKIAKKKKYKAIIKTRHAAVGVRGTDFLIVYNPKNRIMTNLTFEGEVQVVKIKDRLLQ